MMYAIPNLCRAARSPTTGTDRCRCGTGCSATAAPSRETFIDGNRRRSRGDRSARRRQRPPVERAGSRSRRTDQSKSCPRDQRVARGVASARDVIETTRFARRELNSADTSSARGQSSVPSRRRTSRSHRTRVRRRAAGPADRAGDRHEAQRPCRHRRRHADRADAVRQLSVALSM